MEHIIPNPQVTIYTDGSAPENGKGHGKGGYCAILVSGEHERVVSGHAEDTTNNRCEMMAVLEGLKALKRRCKVTVVTDSEYVAKGITEWMPKWSINGWRGSNHKPVKNQDLWAQLHLETLEHYITWEWVRGHNGHEYNERCDVIARQESGI